MGKQLSARECAERHGVSRSSILYAIQRGDIEATKVGNQWVVSEEACAAYRPLSRAEAGKKGGAVMAAAWQAKRGSQLAPRRPVGRPRKMPRTGPLAVPGPEPIPASQRRSALGFLKGRTGGTAAYEQARQDEIALEDRWLGQTIDGLPMGAKRSEVR